MKESPRPRRWAPSIAAVAAFGALGAICAYWALQLLAPPVAIAPTGSLVDTRNVPDLDAAQALFGSAGGAAVSGAPALDLRVLGVAASPSRGSAVLAVGSRAPRAYLVGDEIGTDLRLVEVRSDGAVVERKGSRIELPAPQRPSVALLTSGPQAAGAPSAEVSPPIDVREPRADELRSPPPPAAQPPAARAPDSLPADDPPPGSSMPSSYGVPNVGSPAPSGGGPNVGSPAPSGGVPNVGAPPAAGIRPGSVRNLQVPAGAAASAGDRAH
ncbi:MAG: hypothetical protein M9885_02015 [Burkholderiaceae bacterium]|nr:hypothetical protein [Burkholderiaceae bacterium]